MNQDYGRNVGTPTAGLVQAEHLKASRNSEEDDCWGEEDANVMVRQSDGFEAGCGGHLV